MRNEVRYCECGHEIVATWKCFSCAVVRTWPQNVTWIPVIMCYSCGVRMAPVNHEARELDSNFDEYGQPVGELKKMQENSIKCNEESIKKGEVEHPAMEEAGMFERFWTKLFG